MYLFSATPPPEEPRKGCFSIFPLRWCIALMMFFACWVNYMMRVNMSVNIIAMVPDVKDEGGLSALSETIDFNDTHKCQLVDPRVVERPRSVIQPDHVVTFTWTTQQQAYVLSGYFWGYALTCLIGGIVSELYGPKKVVMSTMMFGGIVTIASPWAAKIHYRALVVARFLVGCSGGFLFPALHTLLAHWAPPHEKGKFVSALLGGAIGTVVTWSLSGPLIGALGWDYAFYVPGAIAVFWCILWWFLVYDSPLLHPRISEKEKKYILDAIGDKVTQRKTKVVAPFKRILTSSPFLAQVVLLYGSDWGLYFIMTAAPKYMSTVLGFNLTASGSLSSLPYLGRMLFSIIFGVIGDKIVKEKWMSMTVMRKFFTFFSHVMPGLMLLALGYTTHTMACVTLIAFSLAFNGAAALTCLVNHQDLAPNFAGTLFGMANGIGNTAGFITPLVTAHFTKHGNTLNEWRPAFLVGAGTYIGSAIYFVIFGSGKTQPWNYIGVPPK